jgi:hypothetical protein
MPIIMKILKICLLSATLAISTLGLAQKNKNEFVISIYCPPPYAFLNDEQYKNIKEGGVDIVFNVGGDVRSDRQGNLETLEMAQKHGLKVYVHDPRMAQSDEKIAEMVNDYKSHPALGGYYITDEPDSARLQSVIEQQRKVALLDPSKDSYVNHLPDWAVNHYEDDFLKRWVEGVGAKNLRYLAFDNYPYKRKQRAEKTHFQNLDIIRRVGLEYDVMTSSCLQSFGMYFSGVEEIRRPNKDEMRLNCFSNLAYGVKNPVWYPYWTKIRHNNILTMSYSIIDENGKKTDLYEPFKMYNWQMKQLGKTLINLDAQEVYHTGDSLWLGTTHPPADFLWKVANPGADVIVSLFKEKKGGKTYIMVVNKSFKETKEFTFSISSSVKGVMEISKETGKAVKAGFDSKGHTLTASFLPGEGRLYALK